MNNNVTGLDIDSSNINESVDSVINPDEKDSKQDNKKVITPGQLVIKRFLRNKLAIVGIFIILFMFMFSFAGPLFSSYGEYDIFFLDKNGVEFVNKEEIDFTQEGIALNLRANPSLNHFLGTDKDGRDVFTRLMYGGRISLIIGFIAIFIQLLIGVSLGGAAGYYGKFIDNLIMRIVDIFNSIPSIPIMLIISSAMLVLEIDQKNKIYILMLVIAFLGWAGIARLVRGQILGLREQEFMIATEATGIKTYKKIFKHLIPNVMPQLIVFATLGLGSVILLESALSFLGIGVPFPYASWGNMVNAVNDPIIMNQHLNIWLPPGLCILVTVMGFNFIGDGLRDAFDPKMKR